MKKLSIYIFALTLCAGLGACNQWFDVQPKRLTEESKLFSTEAGFKEALTGIYIKSAKPELYGKELTSGYLDMIAQRYAGVTAEADYDFSTTSATNAAHIYELWTGMYEVIANINNLLWWIDQRAEVLKTPGYYEIIKGEALALRSYYYFDLLRLFGPIYSQEPTAKSIPYRTEFNRDVAELQNADVMLGHIIDDLLQAHDLLAEADNLDFAYTVNANAKTQAAPGEDPFLAFRFKRMNLLAAKALLARVYLWQGDKVKAAQYAQEVIGSGKFTVLSTMKVTARQPIGELIFGLHFDDANSHEKNNKLMNTAYHIQKQEVFDAMFEVSTYGMNDMRIRIGSGFFDVNGVNFTSLKYDVTGVVEALKNTVPMLKVTEMYYILAECTDNLAQARTYLDQVRNPRGLEALPPFASEEERLAAIELEYRKDFYAEGQSWYFYKRHFYRTFYGCPVENMTTANYIFQIPDDEFLFGSISK